MDWTDEVKIGVLGLWIQFAQYPWYHNNGGANKKLVRETIEDLLRTKEILVGGALLPLREVTTSWETVLDNLRGKVNGKGKGKGFSFDHTKPMLEYIDDHMKGTSKYKPH